MRWLCVLLGLFVTAVAAVGQQAELERLESVWNAAHMQADANTLDRLWHDDLLVVVPRMPVMSKAETLAFVRSGRMTFQKYDTSELKIRMYGDTAIATGRLRRSRTINERQVDDDWRFTKVYLHDQSGWRVVSFHASDAAPQ